MTTGARLKDDINAGRTGDKVAAFDPAAVPLGTDEEAAGTPTPPSAWIEARRLELATGAAVAGNRPPRHALRWTGWIAASACLLLLLLLIVSAAR